MVEASFPAKAQGRGHFYRESRSSAGKQEKFMKRSSRPPLAPASTQLLQEKWIRARQGAGK